MGNAISSIRAVGYDLAGLSRGVVTISGNRGTLKKVFLDDNFEARLEGMLESLDDRNFEIVGNT